MAALVHLAFRHRQAAPAHVSPDRVGRGVANGQVFTSAAIGFVVTSAVSYAMIPALQATQRGAGLAGGRPSRRPAAGCRLLDGCRQGRRYLSPAIASAVGQLRVGGYPQIGEGPGWHGFVLHRAPNPHDTTYGAVNIGTGAVLIQRKAMQPVQVEPN